MSLKIDKDHGRFRAIVKGAVKHGLKKYLTKEELIGRKGKDFVSIPIPQIDIPNFRFAPHSQGGVGQGEGQEGTPIAAGDEPSSGEAGNAPGQHILEVDITIEELAQILGEELELPKIKPKGAQRIEIERRRYDGISRTGPDSLRHQKRTFKEALRRLMALGGYKPGDAIIPIREDKRYKAGKPRPIQQCNALIVYMMDVSGSMGDEQKQRVRATSFWIDTWLRSQYKGIVNRYIVHDADAKEVKEEQFYHLRESGGTMISSALNCFNKMITDEYDLDQWNIYGFYFSDGDNWSGGDTDKCVTILEEEILPKVNLFCYGQVESAYGSGEFLKELEQSFPEEAVDNLVTVRMEGDEGVYKAIKAFLGKGK